MSRSSNIDVVLRLRNARSFQRRVAAAGAELEAMGLRGAAAFSRFAAKAEALKTFGRSMTRNVTLPLAGLGFVAGKMSIEFSDAMTQIQTQAGGSAGEVRRMRGEVLAFAKSGESSEGPKALADALFRIESAGFRGARALEALKAAEALSTVGHADFESTTTALVSAMNTGIKGTEDLDQTIGILNATVGAGNMRFEDLTAAMGTGILDRAAGLGLSLQDVGAALASLTARGQPAQQSATRMATAFEMMAAPTDAAKERLTDIGLEADTLAKVMQREGLLPALDLFRDKLSKLSKVEQTQALKDMFGTRSSGAIKSLLNGLDDLGGRFDQIGEKSGAFGKALDKTNREPGVQMKQAWAQIQAVLIEFGDVVVPKVIPVVTDLASTVTDLVHWFKRLPPGVRNAAGGFVVFMGILGPIVYALGLMASTVGRLLIVLNGLAKAIAFVRSGMLLLRAQLALLAVRQFAVAAATKVARVAMIAFNLVMLANPVGLVVAGIAALAAGLVVAYKKVEWFREAVDATWNWIKSHWKLLASILGGPIALAAIKIVENWDKIKGAFTGAFGVIKTVVGGVLSLIRDVIDLIDSAFDKINELASKAGDVGDFLVPGGDKGIASDQGLLGIGGVPGLAGGGRVMHGGLVAVGESGPEILKLPGAAEVHPLPLQSGAAGVGGGVRSLNVRVPIYVDGRQIAEANADAIEDAEARR